MSDNANGIYTSVGFIVDQPSIDRAKTAVASVKASIEKAAADTKNATLGTAGLQENLAKLSRNDPLQKMGKEMETLAKETEDASKEVAGLEDKFKRLGRARDERGRFLPGGGSGGPLDSIDPSTGEALGVGSAAAGAAASSIGSRLTRAGSALRALPSTAIPGSSLTTDAVGNLARLSGAIAGVAEKTSLATSVTTALTPALGATTASLAGVSAVALPFIIVAGAAALAIKSLTDEVEKSAKAINSAVDAQRANNQRVLDGLTSDDARKKIEDLNQARELEQGILDKTTASYAAFEQQAQAAADSGQDLASSLTDVIFGRGSTAAGAKAVNSAEEALFQQRETSIANLAKLDAESQDYNALLESGALAVNDAAAALERLSDAALKSADDAGKELQAQQRALAATEEQNKSRLEAIENEKAVLDRQIEVLSSSGVTSEEVTTKIAALNDQLGLLGKESEFINDTALEASRAADARKKASKDAEEAEKKVKAAQESIIKATADYATKQVDIARANQNKLRDIDQAARDKAQDTDRKFFNNLIGITEKSNQDRLESQRKAAEDEYQANLDSQRNLEDLKEDALETETEAVNDRDFLAAARAREGLEKQNKAALKEAERGAEDRARAVEIEERERLIQLEQARNEQLNAYREQQFDNRENLNRQIRDARTAKNDQLKEAQIAYNRELEAQNAFLTQYGVANASFYANQSAMAQAAANGGSTQAGIAAASASTPLNTSGLSGAGSFPSGGFGGLRPITPAARLNNVTNYTTIHANNSQDIYTALDKLGYIPER